MSEGHAETPPRPLLPAGVHVAHLLDVPSLDALRPLMVKVMMLRLLPPYLLVCHLLLLLQHLPVIPLLPLQQLSAFVESARAPVLEVSDEEEVAGASARVTTPPLEGRAERGVSLHAPRVENGGVSLRASLLAPSVGREVPGSDSVAASVHGSVTTKASSFRKAGLQSEMPGKDGEPELGCTQLDGGGLQEDGYMSLDEASAPFPALMPTTPPPRPRPTESVHTPPAQKKLSRCCLRLRPWLPLPCMQGKCQGTTFQIRLSFQRGRSGLLGQGLSYQGLSPQPWPHRGFLASSSLWRACITSRTSHIMACSSSVRNLTSRRKACKS